MNISEVKRMQDEKDHLMRNEGKNNYSHSAINVMSDANGSGKDVYGDTNQSKAVYDQPREAYDPESKDRMPNAKGKGTGSVVIA